MDPKDVRTPDDLDKFYNYKCYIRFIYKPYILWASKDKMQGAEKRTCGIKYIINQIDIIQLPYDNTTNSLQKSIFTKYAFGNKQLLTNKISETSNVTETNNVVVKESTESEKKDSKKEIKVDSDESDSESDESEELEESEESEESESESESEEPPKVEAPKKTTKNTKIVVEAPKPVETKQKNKKTK